MLHILLLLLKIIGIILLAVLALLLLFLLAVLFVPVRIRETARITAGSKGRRPSPGCFVPCHSAWLMTGIWLCPLSSLDFR